MSDAYSEVAISGQKLVSQMRRLRLQAAAEEHERIAEEQARLSAMLAALRELAALSREFGAQVKSLRQDANTLAEAVAEARRELGTIGSSKGRDNDVAVSRLIGTRT